MLHGLGQSISYGDESAYDMYVMDVGRYLLGCGWTVSMHMYGV